MMAPTRKLDWDEARRLHFEHGLSFSEIGRRFGVKGDAVRAACSPERRTRQRAAALATMQRKRKTGEYRHHDLTVCPGCLGVKSRRGQVCRRCAGRKVRPEFGWRFVFWPEPDGSFSWSVFEDQTDVVLQSGTSIDWDEARLAAVEHLYPPGPERLRT
jgi:hypothetical protein